MSLAEELAGIIAIGEVRRLLGDHRLDGAHFACLYGGTLHVPPAAYDLLQVPEETESVWSSLRVLRGSEAPTDRDIERWRRMDAAGDATFRDDLRRLQWPQDGGRHLVMLRESTENDHA